MLVDLLKREWNRFLAWWDSFWFGPIDLLPASLFRFAFCWILFFFYFIRFLDFEFILSNKGIFPFDKFYEVIPEIYESPIPWEWFAQWDGVSYVLHIVFLIGLALLALGVIGRNGAWLVLILHMIFMRRNPLVTYGADMVASCFLLYLAMIRTNAYFTLGNLLDKTKKKAKKVTKKVVEQKSDMLSTVGIRLIQIQLCVIYAYSGLEKAKGTTWWQGGAIWNSLSNGQLVTFDFSFLVHFPIVVALMSFLTVFWEVFFPFLVVQPSLRNYVLIFGAFLHLGIAFAINIPFFSMVMISSYLVFVSRKDLEFLFKKLGKASWLKPSPS